MPTPKSAVDVIAPAFEQTKHQLFQPFRFATWARLAVVSILTGEFATGGWGGPSNINIPINTQPDRKLSLLAEPVMDQWMKFLPWILVGMVALICLWIAWVYVESVFRFLLFDAVLRSRYAIRPGWQRWKEAGGSYFLWQMGFNGVELAVLAVIAGVPALVAWRAGIFKHAEDHLWLLIGGGALVFFGIMLAVVVALLISVLAKDFVVPVMAMENARVLEGWRRLLPMLRAEKGAYAGYVLMKIVLSVGSAILFGIVNVAVFFVLLIPAGILGAALAMLGIAGGWTWNAYTIGAAVILGVSAVVAIFYVMGFLYAPGLVFFQSYTIRFLGSRYAPLEAALAEASSATAAPTASPSGP